jgi:LPS-assembly lipoprotein
VKYSNNVTLTAKLFSLGSLLIFVGSLLPSGCGFQLRGALATHLSKVYVQSEAADGITNEVKRLLIEEGVQVVPVTKEAQVILYLRHEVFDRRVLSVSAVSGKMQEMELYYRVEIEARKPENNTVLDQQVLSLSRDYTFEETAVLAMGEEEQMLREEMFRDLTSQILRRLQRLPVK